MNDGYIAAQRAYDRMEPNDDWLQQEEAERDHAACDVIDFITKLTPRDLLALGRGMHDDGLTAERLMECFRSYANEEQRKRVLG